MSSGEPYNISYFFETLPPEFDNWDLNTKAAYFTEWLVGYAEVPALIKDWIVEKVYYSDLMLLYEYVFELVEGDALSYSNATEVLFQVMHDVFVESQPPTEGPMEKICKDAEKVHSLSMQIYLIPAFLLVLMLSFLPRRKQLNKTCCWAKPAIIYPIDFINDRKHRLQFACMFGVMALRAIVLFSGSYFWKPSIYDDEDFTKTWGWTKVFLVWLNIILLGIVIYPMLVFITQSKHMLCNVAGIIGALVWSIEDLIIIYACTSESVWVYDSIPELSVQIPIVAIYLVLIISFAYDFVKNLHAYCKKKEHMNVYTENQMKAMEYLAGLLKRPQSKEPQTLKEKAEEKLLYKRLEGYRYSPRIVCTMVLGLMCLYQLCVTIGVYVRLLSVVLLESEPDIIEFAEDYNITTNSGIIYDHVRCIRYGLEFCCYLSFVIEILLMCHSIVCYREHVCLTYKGDRSWYGKRPIAPANILVSGMRYSGYQVAYLLYGFFILFGVMFIVSQFLGIMLIIPLIHGYTTIVIEKIKQLWPTVLIGLALFQGQILLAKFAFLQDRGAVLALNNRRAYHVVSFFLFFLNIVLGLFSCLRRILISLVLGTVLVSRLDRCLLMKGFEGFDAGFSSYIGMIESDIQHNHPLVNGFIFILKEAALKRKENAKSADSDDIVISIQTDMNGLGSETSTDDVCTEKKQNGNGLNLETSTDDDACANKKQDGIQHDKKTKFAKRPLKCRNKWWKAITMYNNPSIVLERLQVKIDEVKKQDAQSLKTEAVDAMISASTVLVISPTYELSSF